MAPRIFREGLAPRHRVLALTVSISIPQPNNQMEPARQTVCAIMRRGARLIWTVRRTPRIANEPPPVPPQPTEEELDLKGEMKYLSLFTRASHQGDDGRMRRPGMADA